MYICILCIYIYITIMGQDHYNFPLMVLSKEHGAVCSQFPGSHRSPRDPPAYCMIDDVWQEHIVDVSLYLKDSKRSKHR